MNGPKIRNSHFPVRLFFILFGVMILVAGIHEGIIVLMEVVKVPAYIEPGIILVYWVAVAIGVTRYIQLQMKKAYEIPMRTLANATARVAKGDFSVYVPIIHTADRYDYLDVMIMDFNRMVEELGSVETLKTDFFSNVSHEIKTPLAVISNYAQLLTKDGTLDVTQRLHLDEIIQASERLNNMITNILKLNRLEKQQINPEIGKFDLCAQLVECALQFENEWEKRGIDFVVDIEDRAMIVSDRGLLELVWTNLISNALKFTLDGGKVTIFEQSTPDEIVVKVIDDGCGMDNETTKHIFDKFYQGDSSHATQGNGLGLAISYRVCQILGVEITVESEISKGTTFTIRVPKGAHQGGL